MSNKVDLVNDFMQLSNIVRKTSWDGFFLDPEERFVINKVLNGGDISINPSTLKVLRSVTNRKRSSQSR